MSTRSMWTWFAQVKILNISKMVERETKKSNDRHPNDFKFLPVSEEKKNAIKKKGIIFYTW